MVCANYLPTDTNCAWNHGGGTALGFGYDEMYPDDMLSLSQIGNALSDSGIKFDIVGLTRALWVRLKRIYA